MTSWRSYSWPRLVCLGVFLSSWAFLYAAGEYFPLVSSSRSCRTSRRFHRRRSSLVFLPSLPLEGILVLGIGMSQSTVSCSLGIFSCIGESFELRRRRRRGQNTSVELTTFPLPAVLLQSSTPSPRSSVRPLHYLSPRFTADSLPLPSSSLPIPYREGQSRLSFESSLVEERLLLITSPSSLLRFTSSETPLFLDSSQSSTSLASSL